MIRAALLILMLASWPSFAQEFDLQQYLQLLRSAPGSTVSQKMDFLSAMGIKLSNKGMRDLENAASSNTGSNSTWSAPRPRSSWSPTPPEDFSSNWSSTANRNGQSTNYNFDNGVTGNSSRIGNHTHYNFDHGVAGSNIDIGNFSYQNFNHGLTGSTSRVGEQTYQNWNNGTSSTSSRIGNTTYHNYNNGVTGTSTQIGNTTYHTFSNGRSCRTTRIGSQVNTRCQ